MKIYFTLLTSDTEFNFVSEADLIENIDKYRSFLSLERKPHIAKLLIEVPDQPPLEIIDEMWNAALSFCFYQVGEVLKNGKGLYKIAMGMGKSVQLESLESDLITLTTDEGLFKYEKKVLLKNLYNCGVRYLEFLNVLNDENHNKNGIYIDNYRKGVAKLLEAEGLL
jgi:hypothetical protein